VLAAAPGCASGGSPDGGARRPDAPLALDGGPDTPRGPDAAPGCVDLDEDGFGVGGSCTGLTDCDDGEPAVSPEATEVCNGVDDDCDGEDDEGLGVESCGVGACARTVDRCAGGAPQACTPGTAGTETCNSLDDDCDARTDEGFGEAVTCGVGACERTVSDCAGGTTMTCTPGTPGVEVCNGIDDDCDGTVDDNLGTTTCGLGRCVATAPTCLAGGPGLCTPNTGAARAETCDNVDDDCDGVPDDGIPDLTCGLGACARSATACVAGVPQTCTPGTPSAEICGDAIDQDCNGVVEGPPASDRCTGAIAYTIGSTVSGENACSNADHAGSCGGASGADVSYVFTSTGSPTRYTVRMTGAAGYDTVLHAHASTACSTADELACNNDTGAANVSEITIDNPPSGPVYLVADQILSGPGSTFTLTSSSTALNHDTCAGAIPIRGNGSYTGTTVGKTSNWTGLSCQTSTSGPDVVYVLTARASGTITLESCGPGFDTVLAVGTTCGTWTTACDDDGASCTLGSRLSFPATAGTTYYILVDGYLGDSGTYTLTVSGY
jgi:hypothetical protein